ncbi:MAG TPA: hypothetical protein VMV90_04060 [Rectinemataceae bacterium]|nr:hypothetical protein [Rectinemataceae bacterium]
MIMPIGDTERPNEWATSGTRAFLAVLMSCRDMMAAPAVAKVRAFSRSMDRDRRGVQLSVVAGRSVGGAHRKRNREAKAISAE